MRDITYHYPPDLYALMTDAIPLLCKGKKDVLTFFKGAGVADALLGDLASRLATDPKSIGKREIANTVLERLNARGESTLRERREVLRRVVEFESFAACWPDDQLKARGLVAEIAKLVNVKDSVTKISLERERAVQAQQATYREAIAKAQHREQELLQVKGQLYALFSESNAAVRGKKLESVLNHLFQVYGILVREAFTVKGDQGEGIVEQIDGVIELDGSLYLVEMKWWSEPLGVKEISQHLVRVFTRGDVRGIFISTSPYTEAAVKTCGDALTQKTVVLCLLEELVHLMEASGDLASFLRKKVQAAQMEKKPLVRVT